MLIYILLNEPLESTYAVSVFSGMINTLMLIKVNIIIILHEVDTVITVMHKESERDIELFAQGHIASKWQSGNSNSCVLTSESIISFTMLLLNVLLTLGFVYILFHPSGILVSVLLCTRTLVHAEHSP